MLPDRFHSCNFPARRSVLSGSHLHFSNHTAFPSFYFEDYTEKMPAYIAEWKKLGLSFDGIQIGFLGSHRQFDVVQDFIRFFRSSETWCSWIR